MTFISHALNTHQQEQRPLGVTNIFQIVGWRLMLVRRASNQLQFVGLRLICYVLWLKIRACAIIISHFGIGRRDFASTFDIRDYILVCAPKPPCVD